MSVVIRKCTVSDLENSKNFPSLLSEYAKELIVEGAPPASAKMEMYHQLETAGAMQVFGAFLDEQVVGLVTVLVTTLPHYGIVMAVTESFFVLRDFRRTGAGDTLLHCAEQNAKERGAPCLLVSAPSGGVLADVLEKKKPYVETNRVFFRSLVDV